MERTIEEKLQGISYLESLGLDNETIEAIEDSIDHPETMIKAESLKEFIAKCK